jgi:hypothetical protein
MSFGTEVGKFLTSSNVFKADLIIGDEQKIPLAFDTFELIYIEGYQFFIRFGREDSPGSRNELTLEAKELKAGQTYPIQPQDPGVRATFALEEHIEYSPAHYSGMLTVDRLGYRDGTLDIGMRFSLYFESPEKGEMEVVCQVLELTTAMAQGTGAEGRFVPSPPAVDGDQARETKVPNFCEISVRHDGRYEAIDLSNVFFVIYPDSTYFIKCTPRHGGDRANLEFRGRDLRAFTDYPITGPDGPPNSVETFFLMQPEFSQGFSDPAGRFRVRRTEDSEEGFWFIGEFECSLTARGSDGKDITYEIQSNAFQVQVSDHLTSALNR